LQEQTARLNKYARQTELNISTKKTKIMTTNATPEPLTINNDQLEEVEDFTYLGTALSKDNGTGKDIKTRLSKARAAFAKLHPIWKSSKYSTKIHLYNSHVKSVLLYGSECRRIIESDIKKLKSSTIVTCQEQHGGGQLHQSWRKCIFLWARLSTLQRTEGDGDNLCPIGDKEDK